MRRLLMQLGGLFAVAVVAFCGAGVLHDRPDWAHGVRTAAIDTRDAVSSWTERSAHSVRSTVTAWLDRKPSDAPPLRGTQGEEQTAPEARPVTPTVVATAEPVAPAPAQVAAIPETPKPPAPQIIEQPAPQVAQAPAPQVATETVRQTATAPAPIAPAAQPAPNTQVASASRPMPSPEQIARVRDRLRASLSADLFKNFDLFLYVSKADHGPWAQRMFVFAKQDQKLQLTHTWPVSTGREQTERDAHGHLRITATPAGYYQLDPGRMMREHRSAQWDAPMPYAMFFNWVRRGSPTGLAIHGVEGDEVALLGTRASAGCVRLSPQSAQELFDLVRENYRGEVPRFAMTQRRYSTMTTQGELMRNRNGDLVLAEGYRVLVYIDSYGGEELVSALY